MVFLLALGLASLVGSRATTLGVLAALQLLITPVVQRLHNPASVPRPSSASRSGNSHPASCKNGAPPAHLTMSLAAVVAVLVGWMLLAVGLGALRTGTRDA